MVRERRLFSEEFKREAVKPVAHPGVSKSAIARDLGMAANFLGRRCREANVDAEGTGIRRQAAQPAIDFTNTVKADKTPCNFIRAVDYLI